MKKRTAGLALAAVASFSILSATPAFAVTDGPYPDCTAAAEDGVYNIQNGDYRFVAEQDRDGNGVACQDPDQPLTEIVVTPVMPTPPPTPTDSPTPTDQMTNIPKGGVDAGVATEKATDFGSVALGGGLLLAAAGAGTYVIRRRSGNHA